MTLPICDICAQSGTLCDTCRKKLKRKEISDLDVEIAKIVYELNEKSGGDEDKIGFDRAIDTGEVALILTKKSDVGKFIGKGGKNLRIISKKLKKKADSLRIVGFGDLSEILYDLTYPAKVLGVSKVYKTDGATVRRVRIDNKDKGSLKIKVDAIESVISSLSGEDVEVVFV